jgi:hypothetical protein
MAVLKAINESLTVAFMNLWEDARVFSSQSVSCRLSYRQKTK